MAVIGNAPFQGLVSGGEILDASIEGVDLSTSAIAARLGYTPVNPGAAAITAGSINNTTIGATTASSAKFSTGLVGTNANFTDFPNAQFIGSQADTGGAHIYNIGVAGEGVATDVAGGGQWGVGVYGAGLSAGATRGIGVVGNGHVSNTADTAAAIGVRGYATQTHSGGQNIGLYSQATGGGHNYALFMSSGNIYSAVAQTWAIPDNTANALSIDTTGKAGILAITTTDGAESVTMSGNVGIGTSSPGSKFDILRSSTTTTAFDESLIRAMNTGAATLNQRVDVAMRWQDGTYNGTGGISMIRESATARSGGLSFSSIGSDGNATNAMRLDSSGNLGIGTTTPAGKLTVDPGSTSGTRIDGLHLPKNLTAQANYLAWQQGANGWRAGIAYNDSTYPLAFYYGASTPTAASPGTELMRVTSSGDLSITGSLRSFASPAFSLGGNQYTDIMYIGAGGYGAIISGILTVYSTYSGAVTQNSYFVNVIGHGGGTGISMLSQGNYSTPATTIVYDRSQVLGGGSRVISVYNATGTGITMSYSFSPVGANNSAAYYSTLYNTGTAGAGTGIPPGDAVYFGQNYATVKAANIIFPSSQSASSDANTLDDYEESTWTPVITGCTVSVARSSVTKIGRLVTVSATITLNSVSGSSAVQITNMPYPGTNGEFTGSIMLNNVVYTGDPVIYCYPPNQFFEIYLSTSNGTWVQLTNSNLSVNDTLIFSITYIAT